MSVIAFLAASWQRAIVAPINPAYKQEEFEFSIDDLRSALALVPRGSFRQDGAAVRAARKYKAAVAECYWNGQEVALDIKDNGKLSDEGSQSVQNAQPEDIALVLYTSGTTGRPKAVCYHSPADSHKRVGTYALQVPLTHRNLIRTMTS